VGGEYPADLMSGRAGVGSRTIVLTHVW
jgi:hypothetical protein